MSKVSIFINGSHFYRGFKGCTEENGHFTIDFNALSTYIAQQVGDEDMKVWCTYYYANVEEGERGEPKSEPQINLTKFLDMLSETPGYRVRRFSQRPGKIKDHKTGAEVKYYPPTGLDVQMAIDVMELLQQHPDHTFVFVSPDYAQDTTINYLSIRGARLFTAGWKPSARRNMRINCLGYLRLAEGIDEFRRVYSD